MRTLGYVRVSGAGQVDKDGPERQEESIRAFCKQHGLPLEWVHFEAGVSGTVEGMNRPAFSGMMLDIDKRAPEPTCVVVERMDRLARDLMVQEFLLKECRERGIVVYAADQGVLIDMASDGGDPTRKLIRQVLGALAEWEKSALVLKLRKARERKRQETGRCEGPAPYGDTPQEKVVVETVMNLHRKGVSLGQIAGALTRAGFVPRFGGRWSMKS